MHLATPCMECFREDGEPSELPIFVEFVSDGLLIGTCSRGHQCPLVVQEQPCEILFDMGSMALLDGYTREATSTMHLAIERLHDVYVRSVLHENGINKENIDEYSKFVSRQSERQLGAFLTLYLSVEGTLPTSVTEWQEWSTQRNRWVHQGAIPSRESAYKLGETYYNYGWNLVELIKSKHRGGLDQVRHEHIVHVRGDDLSTNTSFTSIPTQLSFASAQDDDIPSFDSALNKIARYRKWLWASFPQST